MAGSTADLERLIKQATPRVEDHRSVDRTDIIRREHGHLNFREVCNSVDALEFSSSSFTRCMKELVKRDATDKEDATLASSTAVHGLLRAIDGLCLLTPPVVSAAGTGKDAKSEVEACEPAGSATEGWQDKAAEAKKNGGDKFKNKDWSGALEYYSAAIRCTPAGDESLSALLSNRSATLLQLGHTAAALNDAQRCAELAPQWPKGHFRTGCCLRQVERLEEAVAAFRQGQALEPSNKDWEREVEKTERQLNAQPSTQARQLVWHLLPELLTAWVRSGAKDGVVQVQVNGELDALGTPKWQFIRDRKEAAKAQLRYAFLDAKGYTANLAANLQSPSEGVAVVDLQGQALKLADIRNFVSKEESSAVFHIDVKLGGKMVAIIGRLPCDDDVKRFVPTHKDPAAPKGSIEGVLQIQAKNGFSKALPRFLGFQSVPGGDLNFPVIDLDRDMPGAVPVQG